MVTVHSLLLKAVNTVVLILNSLMVFIPFTLYIFLYNTENLERKSIKNFNFFKNFAKNAK